MLAFTELYERYLQSVAAHARRVTTDRHVARDVVKEVFVRGHLVDPLAVRLGQSALAPLLDGLAEGRTLVRYDERGSGLSDRE